MGMASKIATSNSSSSLNESKTEEKKHIAKVVKASCSQNIIDHILNEIDRKKVVEPSQSFCKSMKSSLDKNFKKEWNVFIGGHFCGACVVVEGESIELMINDNIKVVIFRSFSA